MKRNNSQSLSRQVKREHVKFVPSTFIKNADGTPYIQKQRRTTRGKWINA